MKRIILEFLPAVLSCGLVGCNGGFHARVNLASTVAAASVVAGDDTSGPDNPPTSRPCSVSNGTGAQELANGVYGACVVSSCNSGYVLADNMCLSVEKPYRVVGAPANGFPYAYAPSIIFAQGQYHAYFCSTGLGGKEWDRIRHVTSNDLVGWSAPDTALASVAVERADCDPSVVLFDAGDGPYYYMVYSGNAANVQTLNFVARGLSPAGPFAKYTDRKTWEYYPNDPHAIIWPFHRSADNSNVYGAGQPTLVVKDGIVYQWYNDTTADMANQTPRIYLVTSSNMVDWSSPQATNVSNASVDVKYDAVTGVFVMFEILNEHSAQAEAAIQTSSDGISWSDPQVICDSNCLPHWANNIGVSGDEHGYLIHGPQTLIAYGAPVDLNPSYNNDCKISPAPFCWGHWDIYGNLVDLGSVMASGATQAISFINAQSNDTSSGWSASNVLDNSSGSVYSSAIFADNYNTRGTFVAAWFEHLQNVSSLLLTARMNNGQALAFPTIYDIYATDSSNSRWVSLGPHSWQPNPQGVVTLNLGALATDGVMIVPQGLGADNYGNHYFQLSDMLCE